MTKMISHLQCLTLYDEEYEHFEEQGDEYFEMTNSKNKSRNVFKMASLNRVNWQQKNVIKKIKGEKNLKVFTMKQECRPNIVIID